MQRLIIILALFCLTSCATRSIHGDAVLIDNSKTMSFFPMVDVLRFPKVSIAERHTRIIRVRNMPQPILPEWAYLDIPREEDDRYSQHQPWRTTHLAILLKTVDGNVFHTNEIYFACDWNGNSRPGSQGRRKIGFQLTPWWHWDNASMPKYTSYDVEIRVLTPSQRHSDELDLDTSTILIKRRAGYIASRN
jgi:hypothetical protein